MDYEKYLDKLLDALIPQEYKPKGLFASLSPKYDTVTTIKNQIHAIVDDDGKGPKINEQLFPSEPFKPTDYDKAKELLFLYTDKFTPFGLPLCNTLIQYDSMVWRGPTKYPFPFLSILVSSIMARYDTELFNFISFMKTDGVNDLANRLKDANLFAKIGVAHWKVVQDRYEEHIKYIGHILKMWPENKNPQIRTKAERFFGTITLEWWAEDRFIEKVLYN